LPGQRNNDFKRRTCTFFAEASFAVEQRSIQQGKMSTCLPRVRKKPLKNKAKLLEVNMQIS